MRTILCYGDSNTWGWIPRSGDRFPRDVRWTGRLQTILGSSYYVIEEGLSGRTTVWDDPIEEHKNGKTYLSPCLESHKPLDLVVLMLGTNDLKKRFSLAPFDIAAGVGKLIDIIQISHAGTDNQTPQILLLTPPPIGSLDAIGQEVFENASPKSRSLSSYLYQISQTKGCSFLDTTTFLQPSLDEGLHLDENGHATLAKEVVAAIKTIFGD